MKNEKVPLSVYLASITFTALFASVVLVIYSKEQWVCSTHIVLTILATFQFGLIIASKTKTSTTPDADKVNDFPNSIRNDSIFEKFFGVLIMTAICIGFFLSYKISIWDNISGGVIKKLPLSITILTLISILPFNIGMHLKNWIKK